jgi:hypothetical protein
MAIPSIFSYHYQKNRFFYFLIFLITNCAITLFGLPTPVQIGLVVVGLGLPLFIAVRSTSHSKPLPPVVDQVELFGNIPIVLTLLGFGLCVFLRFYKLDSFFLWPTGDEGWFGTAAIQLSQQWNWKFFYTWGQLPPLNIWAAAGLMKLGCSPILCLWLPSAVVSSLTVLMGYFAARQFFSRSFSLVFAGLLGFDYWPLLLGRLCQPGSWLPLWECATFYFLGRFLKEDLSKKPELASACLGFVTGLGSLTFTSWPVVALVVMMVVFSKSFLGNAKNPRILYWFLGFFVLAMAPFLLAVVTEGYGWHASSVAAWSGWFPWRHQISVVEHYFTSLFWGTFDKDAAYSPQVWGFLNPLLASFFFLGILEIWPYVRTTLYRWFFWILFLFLLPGLLTMNIESIRIVQAMPLLILMAALGVYSFLSYFNPSRRLWIFAVLLLVSAGLDFYQLAYPFSEYEKHPERIHDGRSLECLKAYQILNSTQQQLGPGLIFTDFDFDCPNNTTLSVMTYPFNAARNPQREPSQAHWAALFVNVNYRPFLEKRFPQSKWNWVGQGLGDNDGGYALAVIPITPENQGDLERWRQAHELMQQTNLLWYSQCPIQWPAIFQSLQGAYPVAQTDLFLESIYWEKTAAYYYKKVDFKDCINAYLQAVNRGYPTAGLFFKLADLLLALKDPLDAMNFYKQATLAPLDLTKASSGLAQLQQRFSTGR